MFNPENTLSSPLLLVNDYLTKVYHDNTLFGNGTKASPLRILSAGSTWGSITGTLSNQTDLQTALNAKLNSSSFVPAGSNTQLQFNNSGAFGASSNLTFSSNLLTVTGNQSIIDTISAGSGSLAGNSLNMATTWNTTGSPTAIKLNVTNTASGAAALLLDLQVGAASKLKITPSGGIVVTNNATWGSVNTYLEITDSNRINYWAGSAGVTGQAHNFGALVNIVHTSGECNFINTAANFSPASGTSTYNHLKIVPTINQTGGANGVTRGIYILPTLTAAADFRAIEISGGKIVVPATMTAGGTTGNQTINKISGSVNIAAAGTSVTVTNNLVTTSSIVFAVVRTNDSTAVIKNVVCSAGSFVINLSAAATAETSIGFFVIN